jgi:hypothetical protein
MGQSQAGGGARHVARNQMKQSRPHVIPIPEIALLYTRGARSCGIGTPSQQIGVKGEEAAAAALGQSGLTCHWVVETTTQTSSLHLRAAMYLRGLRRRGLSIIAGREVLCRSRGAPGDQPARANQWVIVPSIDGRRV